ncbi:hypothetical protein [Ahrensia marina]|uniref:hypothetical protein n=1 Tax=Ahrensia marina TaxID=1514904 RepID=UPI003CCB8E57
MTNSGAHCFDISGIVALIAFAWLFTLAPSRHAERACASYSGVYIFGSLLWPRQIKGQTPD